MQMKCKTRNVDLQQTLCATWGELVHKCVYVHLLFCFVKVQDVSHQPEGNNNTSILQINFCTESSITFKVCLKVNALLKIFL